MANKVTGKLREESRRLFLTGEITTNSEIAARLKLKPHTVGVWRKQEDWDGLRLRIDRRAAEMLVEKIASDRMTLNVKHYRYWELVVARLADELKGKKTLGVRDLERVAGILDRAQKGQRLAKGMSITGETEEAIRAQAEADHRRLVDSFIEAVKRNVVDEETRERIGKAIAESIPEEPGTGVDLDEDEVTH